MYTTSNPILVVACYSIIIECVTTEVHYPCCFCCCCCYCLSCCCSSCCSCCCGCCCCWQKTRVANSSFRGRLAYENKDIHIHVRAYQCNKVGLSCCPTTVKPILSAIPVTFLTYSVLCSGLRPSRNLSEIQYLTHDLLYKVLFLLLLLFHQNYNLLFLSSSSPPTSDLPCCLTE